MDEIGWWNTFGVEKQNAVNHSVIPFSEAI